MGIPVTAVGASAPAEDVPSRLMTLQPAEEQLRELALSAPTARLTHHGSVNVRTRVVGRARRSTFVVSDTSVPATAAVMRRADGERLARLQEAHLASTGAVVVDGYLGAAAPVRFATRIITERSAAPIAGMQRHLLFDPVTDDPSFVPDLTVVCTPTVDVPGTPDGCLVALWPEEGVTRVLGTDFFGETKKAATRMWAERVYDVGGLVLHAACVVVPGPEGPTTALVLGPPDSGKSTLALHDPTTVRLVQDDFVALLPGGMVVPAENGCIEKTAGLHAGRQPVLHGAVTRPDTYLENVPQRRKVPDFAAAGGPSHARAVFPLRSVGGLADEPVPPLRLVVLLDPGHELAPAVARIDRGQVPAYFLLRERAGGLAERSGRHGNRLADLLATASADAAVVNSASVPRDPPGGRRQGASAILAALVGGGVAWEPDHDLRCVAATDVPGLVDPDAVWPRRRFERQDRLAEYAHRLESLRGEWRGYLAEFSGLDPRVVAAVT